jgi:hypothetical protein
LRRLLLFVLLLGLWEVSIAQEKKTLPEGNVCYTENVEVTKGSSFGVKVFVRNIDTLAGMQVPIYYRSETVNLKCDSVSFIGSRCINFALNDKKFEPIGKTVYFCFIAVVDPSQNVKPLAPGDGLVATLWFTAPKDIASGKVKLDSGPNAFFPHEKIDYSFLFWTPAAQQVDCSYKEAYISVK